jgi:hypothetical protein
MPPKKASPAFFQPGGFKTTEKPPPPPKPAKTLKKVCPVVVPPPKSVFFKPGAFRAPVVTEKATATTTAAPRQQFAPRRSFVYNNQTGEPYAEWIGNEAVCLDTGEVLFESKTERCINQKPQAGTFDFKPPPQRHPKDPSIAKL